MIKTKKINLILIIMIINPPSLFCENIYYDPTQPANEMNLEKMKQEEEEKSSKINQAKLTFIFYSPSSSRCVIDGEELHENDNFYGFKVKHIFNNHVLLENNNGYQKNIYLAKGFSEIENKDFKR